MTDERIKILAEKLVGYSVAAKKNDKVLVEAFDVETPLIEEIIKNIYKVGAIPFVDVYSNKIQRRLLMQADENSYGLDKIRKSQNAGYGLLYRRARRI